MTIVVISLVVSNMGIEKTFLSTGSIAIDASVPLDEDFPI